MVCGEYDDKSVVVVVVVDNNGGGGGNGDKPSTCQRERENISRPLVL